MTGLMVEASRKFHTTDGVLLLSEVGVRHAEEALMELKTASWRTSAANSRSELAIVPPGLVELTSFQTMSTVYFGRQVKLMPSSLRLV